MAPGLDTGPCPVYAVPHTFAGGIRESDLGRRVTVASKATEPGVAGATAATGDSFEPAATFAGPRHGMVFKTGGKGTGYYPDTVGPRAIPRTSR